ncbi:MAG: hypothetical protein EAX81_04205 [Candidatus Thorarchaeota archaeon]|nr:hypothetical protein [Candidatus Thorarchaeota archaeon]
MRERMTAVRSNVADIVNGTFGSENGPHVISPYGVELRRVALVGFIIDRYVGQGNFASITIDDGTETIKAKAWGTEASALEKIEANKLALFVGKIREYESEIYLVPEIIRELDDPNYMSLHLMERYHALLTRSGITSPITSDLEETLLDATSSPTDMAQTTRVTSGSGLRKIDKQILQYVELHTTPQGVSINDIAEFFAERDYDKVEINLRVIALCDRDLLREVETGRYLLMNG